MTIELNVKVDVQTTRGEGLIDRALRWWIRDILVDNPELFDPDEATCGDLLGVIEKVEVKSIWT